MLRVIDLRIISLFTGIFLVHLALLMLLPAAIEITHSGVWLWHFLQSATITACAAALLLYFARDLRTKLGQLVIRIREMFLLTTLVWIAVSCFAALPFIFIPDIDYTDAFFETMSGITTTGSTVLSNLSEMPHSVLLWRSLLQWLGGIGFIVTGVGILPFLNVGGMRLFATESSDWSEKPLPRTRQYTQQLLLIYLGMTLLCGLCYLGTGMNWFEAINHAATTVSTGGYSTDDRSLAAFSHSAHWVAAVFMFLGGVPFILFINWWRHRRWHIWQDQQLIGYMKLVLFSVLLLTSWLVLAKQTPMLDAVRLSAVNALSVITTTGFALTDYSAWGHFATAVFFLLMFTGACSGSTSGGVKVFRYQVAFTVISQHLRKLLHPRGVFPRRYNGRPIDDEILTSVVVMLILMQISLAIITALLSLQGLDLATAFTGALTAVTNVGPGFGPVIGPAGNFQSIPDGAKWILALGMLLGRLEFITVFVLFLPRFWRDR